MNSQQKVRKYMIRDIIRHNLRFWWIIIIVAAALASIMGYKKNSEYQTRFKAMEVVGTQYKVNCQLYSGNIEASDVMARIANLKTVLDSYKMYTSYCEQWSYTLDISDFQRVFVVSTDYSNDFLQVTMTYPQNWDSIGITDSETAITEMNKYLQTAMSVCGDILGEDVIKTLGVGSVVEYDNIPTDKNYETAKKDIIKNIIIGAIIGVVASVSIITLIYLLGKTIKTAQEISETLGLKLLAWFDKDNINKECEKATLVLEDPRNNNKVINCMSLVGCDNDFAMRLKETLGIMSKSVYYIDSNINGDFKQMIEEQKNNYDYIIIASNDSKDTLSAYVTSQLCDSTIVVAETKVHSDDYINQVADTMKLFDIVSSGVVVYEHHK